jgi:hypothetical protein
MAVDMRFVSAAWKKTGTDFSRTLVLTVITSIVTSLAFTGTATTVNRYTTFQVKLSIHISVIVHENDSNQCAEIVDLWNVQVF